MNYFTTLALVAGLYAPAAMVPGPNLLLIGRLSLAGDRRKACAAAYGVTLGSLIWVTAALTGMATLIAHFTWLSLGLRVAGVSYLLWFGISLARNAMHEEGEASAREERLHRTSRLSFSSGLLTSLTNPKSGIFWTSVFASCLPRSPPDWFYFATAVLIAVLSAALHLGIAFGFTSNLVQRIARRFRRPLQLLGAVVLMCLGVHLAFNSHQE